MFPRLLISLLLFSHAVFAQADKLNLDQFGSITSPAEIASRYQIISELSSIAPSEPFTIAIKLDHPAEWHSYYKNSGGPELPLELDWTLPEGSSAGEIQWPTPSIKDSLTGKSFIYEGSPVFLVQITPPADLKIGEKFTFSAEAAWQICKKSCIGEDALLQLSLPVSEKLLIDSQQIDFFIQARENQPKQLAVDTLVSARPDTDKVILKISKLDGPPSNFVPDQPYLKALEDGGTIEAVDSGYEIHLPWKKIDFFDMPIEQGNVVSGISIGGENFLIPVTQIAEVEAETVPTSGFLKILVGMFIGGLILNLMPCVFPVIGLKIMSFVQQAGEDRRVITLHGVSFAAGVFLCFGALSGVLFLARAAALREGGDIVNWGYQLQNPWIVLVLLLLMFLLALNMYGVFEIGTKATSVGGKLQNKSGYSGSFFSGILATVVATPCSAPFLGTAIGATMSLPPTQYFVGFAAMALGLSLPYLVLSAFPALVEKLPRPGAWMESFKQGMSFLLFGTAAYLIWVYSGLIGSDELLAPLIGLCLIATGAWIYGRWFLPHKTKRARSVALLLTLAAVGIGLLISLPPQEEKLWGTWSESRVEEALANNQPVFVDFTARWCVTCQVNKKRAYTDEVLKLAREKNIVFLTADKTRADAAIEAKLAELGRTAIPVNVLYQPDKPLQITPELLTPSILTDLFGKINGDQ